MPGVNSHRFEKIEYLTRTKKGSCSLDWLIKITTYNTRAFIEYIYENLVTHVLHTCKYNVSLIKEIC